MKIYLDDIRVPSSSDYIVVKDMFTAINLIADNWEKIDEISLDHDLGDENIYGTGYRVACFIETYVHECHPKHLPQIYVHSNNSVGRYKIEQTIKNIKSMYNNYMNL